MTEKNKTFKLEHKNGVYDCELVPDSRSKSIHIRVEPTDDERYHHGPKEKKIDHDINQEMLFPEYTPGRAYVVKVTYPHQVARKRVIETIVDHSAWIETEMQRLQTTSVGFSRRILTNGTPIPYLGGHLTLCVLPAKDGQPEVSRSGDALICQTNSTAQTELRHLLEQWFRQEARKLIAGKIDRLAVGITVKPYKVSVRGQRSRWGSCSQNGTLCFNWKLVMMPDFVIDYLIIHELAHLEEFNHSGRFWKIVKDKHKNVTKAKAWLRKFGPALE